MGKYIKHVSCLECSSSDGLALYDSDGNVNGYCWSCHTWFPADKISEFLHEGFGEVKKVQTDFNEILSLPMRGWKDRRVGKPVSELYNVHSEMNGDNPSKRFYPVQESGKIVGFHVRDCNNKAFFNLGSNRVSSEFFGQHLFPAGGKYLVITGGAEDAMSLQQELKRKNPKFTTAVVSPTCGEGSTANQIKANYEWVTSFEKVILMLDNDEAGKKATEESLKLLKPGQGYIARLHLKDPNEYVKVGRGDELVAAFWKAERHSPIDLMTLGQMWEDFEKEDKNEIIPFPPEYHKLNEMMNGGPARGEITTIGALTSVGKTSHIMRWVYHWIMKTNQKPGLLMLESTPKEIVRTLLSIHIKKNLALEARENYNLVELKKKFNEILSDGDRVISINHQGSFASSDELFQKIEWMVVAMDVTCVVIDPLQLAVPSNENTVIDEFMDKLLKLAKKTNAAIFVISHMRKPEGKDVHDVGEYALKGSSSIVQVSFNTVLISRDKTHENDVVRNTTKFQVVKCRRTGETGDGGWVQFIPKTMEFKGISNPYEFSPEEDHPVFDNSSVGSGVLSEKAETF